MRTTSSRDNWERLVAAVLKREQIWQLCHQDSITTIGSSHFSSYSSNLLRPVPSFPSPQVPPSNTSYIQAQIAEKNASEPITRKLFYALLGRKKPKDDNVDEDLFDIPVDEEDLPIDLGQHRRISIRELLVATDKFSNKNILGRGRHSTVYKGRLADGSLVALKQFTPQLQVMFGKEFQISSLVEHRNVLGLRGFCITEKQRLLVYPYMANGSVASCLRERPESRPPLYWATRTSIALEAAKGLAYLHYECPKKIIHCDVKAANVLLDEDFEAVVADFNLGEIMDCNDDDDNEVSTGIKGTFGHIAPEFFSTGKCSEKSDVFGYGVFLLELITAEKSYDPARLANDDDPLLLGWVKGNLKEKRLEVIVDANLEYNYVVEELERLLQIALLCTQSDPEVRPMMPEVVSWMLEDGDVLAVKWEEMSCRIKDEMHNCSTQNLNIQWSADTSYASPDELSGPR